MYFGYKNTIVQNMATNMRITRRKGESDRLNLPMRTRPTRKETTSGKDRGTVLDTTSNRDQDQHQQTPIQMPQLLTQSPQAKSVRRTGTPALHRPLTPCMPQHHQHRVHNSHNYLLLCLKRTDTVQPQKKKLKRMQK